MNTNKILLAGLAGGAVYFFLGWLLYGMLLMSFFEAHQGAGAAGATRAETDMVWWAMILGNLAAGMVLAIIFGRWANISTVKTGAAAGAVIAGLVALSYDLMIYSTTTMSDLTGVLADVVVYAIMGAAAGAVVAWVLGYQKK